MKEYKSLLNSPVYNPVRDIAPKRPEYNPYENLPLRILKLSKPDALILLVAIMRVRDFPTHKSVMKLVRICELLADPQNHILVKSNQLIEKQIYNRSPTDMKAEMAQELASLPRYTAWVKRVDDSNMILKNKTSIFNAAGFLDKYDKKLMEFLRIFTEKDYKSYCTPRDLIEEEIIKRQAKWRGAMQSSSAGETASDKKGAGSLDKSPPPNRLASEQVSEEKEKNGLGKSKPPPSSIPSQTTAATQEPVKPNIADIPEEPEEEKNLIYRSDFYPPSDDWPEEEEDGIKIFHQDGYHHILIAKQNWWADSILSNITLTDFRACVEAEIIIHTGNNAECGIVFRRTRIDDKYSFYYFSVSRFGYYNVFFKNNKDWRGILTDRFSEFINQGDSVNSLMVEVIGRKITVEVNGHILAIVMDDDPTSGSIGFWLQTAINSTAEARFRNFRIYSLE